MDSRQTCRPEHGWFASRKQKNNRKKKEKEERKKKVPDVESFKTVSGRSDEVQTTVYPAVWNLFSSHYTSLFSQVFVKLFIYLIVYRQPAVGYNLMESWF